MKRKSHPCDGVGFELELVVAIDTVASLRPIGALKSRSHTHVDAVSETGGFKPASTCSRATPASPFGTEPATNETDIQSADRTAPAPNMYG